MNIAVATALLNAALLLPVAWAAGGTLARTQRSLSSSVSATRLAPQGGDGVDYHVVTEPSCPSVECGYSYDGRAHVSEGFMNRVKGEAGILPASPSEGGVVQVTLLTKTSTRHCDAVAGEDISMNAERPKNKHAVPENTPIAFVALNTNENAYFDQEGIGSVPIVKGSLLVFDGSVEHNTVINSGYVKLLGPFQVPSFRLVMAPVETCADRSGNIASCCSDATLNCAVCLEDSDGNTVGKSNLSGKSVRSGSGSGSSSKTGKSSKSSSKSSNGICSARCIDLDDWMEDPRGCFPCADCSCVAGSTGVFRKNTDGATEVTVVSELQPGDMIRGLDESLHISDDCEVLALDDWGFGDLHGNYTFDHYNLHKESGRIVPHGAKGPLTSGEKFTLITTCPAILDEAGVFFTPLDEFTVPSSNEDGSLTFDEYIKFYRLTTAFAASRLIPTAPKHIKEEDAPSDASGWNTILPKCLTEGQECYPYGDVFFEHIDESVLLQAKALVEEKFGLSLPEDIHGLKSAHRILFQRWRRPMRVPLMAHQKL